ncbi:MAG TPA: response regulator [Candidatus Moranbacteria bacterium]|nr:response regulator [Candidatus Moranbacteria bacterium]
MEDDDNIREIYATALSASGFEIVEAFNGEDGIIAIKENNPDIILLDLQMPVMNGFQVMEALQEDEKLSGIPIVVLTNADDDESIKKAGKFETRFYVVKALTTPQKIVGIVREILH